MRIGIDLGGTKIEGVALNDVGETLLRMRVDTPVGDYEATLRGIAQLVHSMERQLDQIGSVGVATPGAISPVSGLIKNSNSICLNDMPLDRDLAQLLARPLRVANDADCFALSEAVDGAAKGGATVFGVIIGTGTGGGIVVNGRLMAGPNAIAGEWGHNPLPWQREDERPGPDCYCGKQGCIETYLSGPGLSHAFYQEYGRQFSAKEIASLADNGDDQAGAMLQCYEDRMARALASVINVIDPEVIVLGGGLSNIARLYENVPAMWGQYVFSDKVATRLVPAAHGDSSGVRGAAWLWPG